MKKNILLLLLLNVTAIVAGNMDYSDNDSDASVMYVLCDKCKEVLPETAIEGHTHDLNLMRAGIIHREGVYICNHCNGNFQNRAGALRHSRIAHPGIR